MNCSVSGLFGPRCHLPQGHCPREEGLEPLNHTTFLERWAGSRLSVPDWDRIFLCLIQSSSAAGLSPQSPSVGRAPPKAADRPQGAGPASPQGLSHLPARKASVPVPAPLGFLRKNVWSGQCQSHGGEKRLVVPNAPPRSQRSQE